MYFYKFYLKTRERSRTKINDLDGTLVIEAENTGNEPVRARFGKTLEIEEFAGLFLIDGAGGVVFRRQREIVVVRGGAELVEIYGSVKNWQTVMI